MPDGSLNLRALTRTDGFGTDLVSLDEGGAVYNIKAAAFGALGDGSTNDAPAFALVDQAGRAIVVPEGTYLIEDNLNLAGGYRFEDGSVLELANGVEVTLSGSFEGSLSQHFVLGVGAQISVTPAIASVLRPEHFGADPTGIADSRDAYQAWADVIGALADGTTVGAGVADQGQYRLTSPVNFLKPRNLRLDLSGTRFAATHDGICLDLHSAAAPASPTDLAFLVHVTGGLFTNSAGTKLSSEGLRILGCRAFTLDGRARFIGFHKAVVLAAQDTYRLEGIWTFQCDYGVEISDFFGSATGSTTLVCSIIQPHFSLAGAQAGVYAVGRFANLSLLGGSSNGAPALASFYAESGGGGGTLSPFQILIQGHHFEQATASSRYVWLASTEGRDFFNVSLVDNSFGVAAQGGADATRGSCRFESTRGIRIANNQAPVTSAGGGCWLFFDADCEDITITRDNFINTANSLAWVASTGKSLNQMVQPSTWGPLVARCTTAGTTGGAEPSWPTTVGGTVADGSVVWTMQCNPIIYECDREEITLEPEQLSLLEQVLTGWDPAIKSGAEDSETLNMRSLLGARFPRLMPPRGYRLNVSVEDTDSAAAVDCWVGLARAAADWSTAAQRRMIQIAGQPDDAVSTQIVEVPCDADGNVYVRWLAEGNMSIRILGIYALQ